MVGDSTKQEVISYIDKIAPHFRGSIYYKDLIGLRKKYIYKDISTEELANDKKRIKAIVDILWHFYTQKDMADDRYAL